MEDTEASLPCAEKMAFDTQVEAESAATAAEWQYGGALKTYHCQHCGLWHLSSS